MITNTLRCLWISLPQITVINDPFSTMESPFAVGYVSNIYFLHVLNGVGKAAT